MYHLATVMHCIRFEAELNALVLFLCYVLVVFEL